VPKVLETLNHAPEVYQAADRYMEAMDWITWMLTGEETRSINGLGYKAFYNYKIGFPSKEFFRALDERMEHFVEEKMNAPIKKIGETAGYLTEQMASVLGLCPQTPVGVPIIDAHCGVIGGGVTKPGEMMLIVGTSFCHHVLSEKEADVYGVCGMVKEGILPGYFAYEAGQSGGGDIYGWFTKNCIPERYEAEAREKGMGIHQLLCDKLKDYKAGQSGLIALDWFNGVRSPLADYNLNGLLLGMDLQTKPEEIYMVLIEATGFGTRLIVEEFEKANVTIDSIVLSGGIPLKNPMLVQVYADILTREISVCQSSQAAAMGAAILGVAAAPSEVTGYDSLVEIIEKIGKCGDKVYYPNEKNNMIYNKLYEEYQMLLEHFGKGTNDVMKRLNEMRGL
jgi:L-ribulokinase